MLTTVSPHHPIEQSTDSAHMVAGRFSAPPLIVNPAASRDDLVGLATARAGQLVHLLDFIACQPGSGTELLPSDIAMLVLGQAEDVHALLHAIRALGGTGPQPLRAA